MEQRPNYITPAGYAPWRGEYDRLFATERPLVETIAWAAGNGDRSENGDYIYGRKRLREIDRRLGWLAKRMKAAKVIDPARAEDRSRVWFGATVTIADEDDNQRVLDPGRRRRGGGGCRSRRLERAHRTGAARGDGGRPAPRAAGRAGEKEYE